LIAIDGVGKAKLEKYGDAFVNAIISFKKIKRKSQKRAFTKRHCFTKVD
jgi:ATP-dependent DNA helicase RecQ